MPRTGAGPDLGDLPLPQGWDLGKDFDGKVYFIDHHNQKTTWVDPRDSLTKPQSFADCVGDELPVGWEQVLDYSRGVYYVNHTDKQVQSEDPRLEWRALQEDMLRQYLVTAQEDLQAKKELVTVKQQRLSLAQDEWNHLNSTLSHLSNSTTSYGLGHPYPPYPGSDYSQVARSPIPNIFQLNSPLSHSTHSLNSTTSTASSTKYDPDLLKADVTHAKARVQRLRRELANIHIEMDYKQRGVETLNNVNAKFTEAGRGLTLEEAAAIRTELLSIQQSLCTGEREKVELMKSLACLKDDLTRLQPSESSLDVSAMRELEQLSTASQTDLSGEMVPIGARLAELARLRLQYDESRRSVQEIQQQLAALEERISPGQLESDNDRLLLIQEKEQLLRELRSINSRNRSKSEMLEVEREIRKLKGDLDNAMEVSNKCIAERLKIHEEKQLLHQQLVDTMWSVSALESQLKLLSASTLSMSSSSSLGSLSSSHASSKGSLSSLSFTDIYGMSSTAQPDSSMLDLHKRVEKILTHQQIEPSGTGGPADEANGSNVNLCMPKTSSQLSLSPRSSLSSVSPPVSPHEPPLLPPSYDQAYLTSVERQKRLQASLPTLLQQPNPQQTLEETLTELRLGGVRTSRRPLARGGGGAHFELGDTGLPYSLAPGLTPQVFLSRRSGQDSVGSDQSSAPLSPISETATDDQKTSTSSNARSVSAAVSDESVAGDSGVFEASRPSKGDLGLSMNLETAQVQVKLRYSSTDDLLHVGIERARNLAALFIPEGRKVCIKAALLPSISNVLCTFCTRAITDLTKPTFGETFRIAISKSKLLTKTLQVNIWAVDRENHEDCLGSAQVSMADFKTSTTSVKWYNVLSFHFMQPEVKRPVSASPRAHHLKQESEISSMNSSRQGTLKEESSDESTIISSQTSTLTRNIGPESMLTQAEYTVEGGIPFQVEEDESDEEDEDNDDDEFVINENTDSFVFPLASPAVDAETNTECVFIQQPQVGRKSSLPASTTAISSSVKRSKTFSPSAPINKTEYNCRLNRSDSDSAMPLYRRLPFQRTSKERRSLHVPTKSQPRPGRLPVPDLPNTKTSIDLELDLAAQQSKLTVLNEEIDRLRQIKSKMEEARDKGGSELPAWFHEDEKFQALLASLEFKKGQKSLEEKRIEKLLKKHAKEIYKLRKTKSIKGQLDVQSFKEKMAFFTSVKAHVPILGGDESEEDSGSEATLRLVNSGLSSCLATPRLNEEDKEDGEEEEEEEEGLKEGLSTETVNTITGEEETTSSQNSTPTPNLQSERFSYDVDPELGAFV